MFYHHPVLSSGLSVHAQQAATLLLKGTGIIAHKNSLLYAHANVVGLHALQVNRERTHEN